MKSINLTLSFTCLLPVLNLQCKAPSVNTPAKPTEARGKKRLDIEDSDSENELIPTENMNLTDDKTKKRLEVEDSDCEDEQKSNENVEGKATDPTTTKKKRRLAHIGHSIC
ncbi:hypothetical protein CTI12_AA102560 [Artemisia annua]|uniref:Uncharacterized protein n=1 Tax=Artemisia annua TaxID=35608 RepID=A0A2U1PX41_ARTAN|nr:hypothetical protein CTI12_AA102560 [Artemisia annua]